MQPDETFVPESEKSLVERPGWTLFILIFCAVGIIAWLGGAIVQIEAVARACGQ